jgi:hypothetical protein
MQPAHRHLMRQVLKPLLGSAIGCAKLTSMYQLEAIECVKLTAICWAKFSAVSHRMRQVHRIVCANFSTIGAQQSDAQLRRVQFTPSLSDVSISRSDCMFTTLHWVE